MTSGSGACYPSPARRRCRRVSKTTVIWAPVDLELGRRSRHGLTTGRFADSRAIGANQRLVCLPHTRKDLRCQRCQTIGLWQARRVRWRANPRQSQRRTAWRPVARPTPSAVPERDLPDNACVVNFRPPAKHVRHRLSLPATTARRRDSTDAVPTEMHIGRTRTAGAGFMRRSQTTSSQPRNQPANVGMCRTRRARSHGCRRERGFSRRGEPVVGRRELRPDESSVAGQSRRNRG
jgi:hypothetical protein